MSYDVGTFIDLTYLNVKHVESKKAAPRAFNFMAVAIDKEQTRFRFMPARHIPVVFA